MASLWFCDAGRLSYVSRDKMPPHNKELVLWSPKQLNRRSPAMNIIFRKKNLSLIQSFLLKAEALKRLDSTLTLIFNLTKLPQIGGNFHSN